MVKELVEALKARGIHAHDLEYVTNDNKKAHYLSVTNEESTVEYLRMHESFFTDLDVDVEWVANIVGMGND